jgi:hypothetical protein
MSKSRGSGAREVNRIIRVRVGSIGFASREFYQLGRACVSSMRRMGARSRAGVHMGQLACLTRSVRWLAGLGDGPMSPSPRVTNSICMCLCIYIYIYSVVVEAVQTPTRRKKINKIENLARSGFYGFVSLISQLHHSNQSVTMVAMPLMQHI